MMSGITEVIEAEIISSVQGMLSNDSREIIERIYSEIQNDGGSFFLHIDVTSDNKNLVQEILSTAELALLNGIAPLQGSLEWVIAIIKGREIIDTVNFIDIHFRRLLPS